MNINKVIINVKGRDFLCINSLLNIKLQFYNLCSPVIKVKVLKYDSKGRDVINNIYIPKKNITNFQSIR